MSMQEELVKIIRDLIIEEAIAIALKEEAKKNSNAHSFFFYSGVESVMRETTNKLNNLCDMANLVILSVYDGGYCVSLLEYGRVIHFDTEESKEGYKLRFGKYPEDMTMEELRKHYPEGTKIIICDDGDIQQ